MDSTERKNHKRQTSHFKNYNHSSVFVFTNLNDNLQADCEKTTPVTLNLLYYLGMTIYFITIIFSAAIRVSPIICTI